MKTELQEISYPITTVAYAFYDNGDSKSTASISIDATGAMVTEIETITGDHREVLREIYPEPTPCDSGRAKQARMALEFFEFSPMRERLLEAVAEQLIIESHARILEQRR